MGFSFADPPTCPVDELPTCAVRANEPICTDPDGWTGNSRTFANRCELLTYNCDCPSYRKVFFM